MNGKHKSAALLMAGLTLYGSLLMTAAAAKPPKHTKKPAKTMPSKVTPAMIAAGKKVYDAQGCSGCHAINGTGGNSGPELTKVAAEAAHTPKWLEVAVVNPKAHNPNSAMPSFEDKVKGADLKNLVAYLGSLKK